MKQFLIVWGILEAISLAGVVLLIAQRFPDNHLSFDVRTIYFIAAVGLLFSLFHWHRTRSRQTARFVLLNLLFAAAIALVDQGNLLVDYEEWIRRGMPPPFSFGASSKP